MAASSAAWLTTVLRPAGSLDPVAVRRLVVALGAPYGGNASHAAEFNLALLRFLEN